MAASKETYPGGNDAQIEALEAVLLLPGEGEGLGESVHSVRVQALAKLTGESVEDVIERIAAQAQSTKGA